MAQKEQVVELLLGRSIEEYWLLWFPAKLGLQFCRHETG
jgi:hypothetical protein